VWFVVVGGSPSVSRRWRLIPGGAVLCGLAGSAVLGGLMIAGRAAPCAACVAVHGLNLLAAAAIWRFFARTRGEEGRDALESCYQNGQSSGAGGRLVFVAFLAVAFSTVGLWMYRAEHLALRGQWRKLMPYKTLVNDLRSDRSFLLCNHQAQNVNPFAGRPGEVAEPGRARLVAFIDYQCPNCGPGTSEVIANAKRAFGERLDVVVRHYPLCAECNESVKGKGGFHAHACEAAWAAEAARLQGGAAAFARMHEQLMRFKGELSADALRGLALNAGLDVERFERNLKGEDVRRAVAADVEMAGRWGVTGTPAFFLDGRRIDRRFEGPALWEALAAQGSKENVATTQTAMSSADEGGRDARPPPPPWPPLSKGGRDARDARPPAEGLQ
jgi:predicted DsbA family dithiol-disulfide isomerase